jgi:hypothetical protein
VYSTQRIKRAAVTLMAGLLLTVAFAVPAQASSGTPKGLTAQQLKAEKARSQAWNRYYHLGASSPSTTAVQLAEDRRAQAMNRFYKLGAYSPAATAAQQAEERRSEAMNRFYKLGAFSPATTAAKQAEERRAQAVDRYYKLGRYAVIRVSNGFVWTDAGIGAGAMLGAIILAGGLAVAVRRRTAGKASFPSTT